MDERSITPSKPTTIIPPSAWVRTGVIIALGIALLGVFGPVIAPHDPFATNFGSVHTKPGTTWAHPLGADHIGRDVLSRLLFSFRVPTFGGGLGVVLGTVAAVLLVAMRAKSAPESSVRRLLPGGVLENSVGRLSIVIIVAGPVPLIAVMAELGSSVMNTLVSTAILASILPMSMIYQAVGRTMADLADLADPGQQPSGDAANQPGPVRLALRAGVVLAPVAFSLSLLLSLLLESVLSFLGVGVPPNVPSLGGMLWSGTQNVAFYWLWVFPTGVMTIAVGALIAVTIPVSHVQQTFHVQAERLREEMEYADLWLRFGSIVIDNVGFLLYFVASILLLMTGFPDLIILPMVLLVLYHVVYLGGWKRSLGNRLFGITVVTADGGPVTMWRSILRALVMVVPPAYLLIPFNRRRRALYDVLAGTVVIKLPPKR